nr:unnamed protein product [Callosobruchus analis]
MSFTFCFDLQQVQLLPRTNINDAFYSHQVSFYCLSCVSTDSRNPIFYTWTENKAGRESTEVASALINFLGSQTYDGVSTVRLFCDGCPGQNRNSHIVHALYFWMRFNTPVHLTEIQLIFPVRVHSFLPADRCFKRVEKLLRKPPTLSFTKEYKHIYEKLGEVGELGIDWRLFQVKDFLSTLKNVNGISSMKKIFLRRYENGTNFQMCLIPNYLFYTGQEIFEGLLKAESVDLGLPFTELNLDRGISEKKKKHKSLRLLMVQEFGEKWEDIQRLQWYKRLLNGTSEEEACQQINEECVIALMKNSQFLFNLFFW